MAEKKKIEKYLPFEHTLTASTFLAGVTFAALLLLMQAEERFEFPPWSAVVYYPELLIGALALLTLLFLFSLVGIPEIRGGEPEPEDKITEWSNNLWVAGWFGLISITPFLVLPFSIVSAIVIGVFAIFLFVRFISWA